MLRCGVSPSSSYLLSRLLHTHIRESHSLSALLSTITATFRTPRDWFLYVRVKEIKPAKQVLEEMVEQASQILASSLSVEVAVG